MGFPKARIPHKTENEEYLKQQKKDILTAIIEGNYEVNETEDDILADLDLKTSSPAKKSRDNTPKKEFNSNQIGLQRKSSIVAKNLSQEQKDMYKKMMI